MRSSLIDDLMSLKPDDSLAEQTVQPLPQKRTQLMDALMQLSPGNPQDQTTQQGPQRLRDVPGTFWNAFTQSLADKPAAMLKGTTAYTQNYGDKLDPALERAAASLESIKDPKKRAEAQAALQGKLWASREDTPWYKIDPKLLPEVVNSWAAQVGDQIPILLSSALGRAVGGAIGSGVAAVAGQAGPQAAVPEEVVTVPMAAVVGKVVGGAAPMVLMETGSYLENASQHGIDKDIAEKYSRIYGPIAGAIEYSQQLWNIKAFKGFSAEGRKHILKTVAKSIGGNVMEGLEEVTQGGLERFLLGKAIDEMEERYPGLQIAKPGITEGMGREFGIGFGIGTIASGAGAVQSEARRGIVRQLDKNNRELLLTPGGADGVAAANPEWAASIAAKDAPSRKDFEDVGITGWNAAERKQFAGLLKNSLEKTPDASTEPQTDVTPADTPSAAEVAPQSDTEAKKAEIQAKIDAIKERGVPDNVEQPDWDAMHTPAESDSLEKPTGKESLQVDEAQKPLTPDGKRTPAPQAAQESQNFSSPSSEAGAADTTVAPALTKDGKKAEPKKIEVEGQTVQRVPTDAIQADPKRFQFKLDATGEGGVTAKLEGIDKWNEKSAGIVLAWQDKDGQLFVVDGHHRLALAKKLGAAELNAFVLKETDGITEKDARVFGAMSNLADEKGTAVDAAKLFRDSNMTPADLAKEGVNHKSELVKQGFAMKALSDAVFRMVIDGKVPANMAAMIGRHLTDHVKQKAVADMIADGQVETAREAELLAKTIDSAPVLRKEEQTLFGKDVTEKSLFAERAKVLANVEAILKQNKKVFGVLSQKSGIIEAAGNVLNKDANKQAKEKADEVLYLLEKLVNSKGPVAEALNEATKQYAENPTKQRLAEVSRELLDKWQRDLTVESVGGILPGLSGPAGDAEGAGKKGQKRDVEGYDETKPPTGGEGQDAGLYAGKGGKVTAKNDNRPNPLVFGLKELVELARQLTGKVPTVRKRLGKAAGRFKHNEDAGEILMRASTAYGPLVSEGDTRYTGERLNGLIVDVVGGLLEKYDVPASDIKVVKTKDGAVTHLEFFLKDPDYAVKLAGHEIGHAAGWLPDKTLKRGNILGHIAALNKFTKSMIGGSPDVIDSVLTDKDKVRLEKEARKIVKGLHPENLKKGERDKMVQEVKRDLIKQEANDRGIYTKDEMMDELKKLTRWWKPIDKGADSDYIAYREQPSELYADAVSVLLNNPEALRQRAPKFYDAFFAYLNQRPELKEAYTSLTDKIYAGTTRSEAVGRLLEGFREGREKHLKQLQQGSVKKRDIWKNVRSLFYSKFAANYKLAREARAKGLIDADNDPINRIGEAMYTANMIEGYMNQMQTQVYNRLREAGIPLEVFDLYLLGNRVIGEKGEKFAPEGMTDADWKDYLNDLRLKYGEKYKVLEDAHDQMRKIRKQEILGKIKDAKYFDQDTMDKLMDEQNYVRFDVVEYIDKRHGYGTGLKMFKRVGTFKKIAGPLESTLLQDMSMLYSLNWNSAKQSVAQLNVRLDKAMEAEKTFDGKRWHFKESTDPDLKLMLYMDQGEMKGFYVDKWQAAGFDSHDPLEYKAIANVANAIAGVQKSIYTALNPAFWIPNIVKDSARTIINVPGANPLNVAIGVIRAMPMAWKSEYGQASPELLEMQRHGAMISRANITGLTSEDTLAGQLMTMYTGRKLDKQGKVVSVGMVERVWEFYKHLGQVSERASKIAAWRMIQKKNPDMSLRDVAQMVRTEAGSPNFAEKGRMTWAINPLALFVNPGIQGLSTDLRIASQPGRRGSFWMKMAAYQILPKLMQWAVGAGLLVTLLKAFGVDDDDEMMVMAKEAQDITNSMSEYTRTNYINIALGRDENGKGVCLTIPMDHTGQAISGILHNALEGNVKGIKKALTNSVHYALEQMPGGSQPLITLGKWWSDYARGQNPYDEYRGRQIIPTNEFEARELDPQRRAAKILAKESIMQLGAGGFYRFKTGDPDQIRGELEKVTYLPGIGPIIGRFVRVSDYGVRQQLMETTEPVKAEKAMARLDIRDATVKQLRGEPLTANEEKLLKDNQAYSTQFADKKKVREQGDAIANALASAASRDERMAMYRKIRDMRGADFDLKPYAEKDMTTSLWLMTAPLTARKSGESLTDYRQRRSAREQERADGLDEIKFFGLTEKEALDLLKQSAKARGYNTVIFENGNLTAYGERYQRIKKEL